MTANVVTSSGLSVYPSAWHSNSTGRIFLKIIDREFLINFVASFKFWLSAAEKIADTLLKAVCPLRHLYNKSDSNIHIFSVS